MVALKASSLGHVRIKQARLAKGWTVDDPCWLEEASNVLGVSWQQQGYLAEGISEGTWKRFLSGKYAVNADAFKAYCQILGLEWQDVIERSNYQDWGTANVSRFYGRTKELELIEDWAIADRCRLVTLLGMGGIGKTALSIKAAQLVADKFEFIIWRSLRNAPPITELLGDLIQFLSQQHQILPSSAAARTVLLLQYLQKSRCLLLLDNAESAIQNRNSPPENDYSQLFKAIAQTPHQSCLILTSRAKISALEPLEGEHLPVRCLQLQGLSLTESQAIISYHTLVSSSSSEWKTIVDRYGGNPLALQVVAGTIQNFFAGKIADFMRVLLKDTFIFDDINNLLQQHIEGLTWLEKQIMYWLAINREPIPFSVLQQDFVNPVPLPKLLSALCSLKKRFLIEKNEDLFSLQPVIMEYITHDLSQQAIAETNTNSLDVFNRIALVKYQAKDYLVKSQEVQILQPIVRELLKIFNTPANLIEHLKKVVIALQQSSDRQQKIGYSTGNIINILKVLKADLSNYDFSGLAVWQANLQGIKLHRVNFTNADLSKSTFTENFGNVLDVAFSHDGKIIATCATDCQIRLWDSGTGKLLAIGKGHRNWVRSIAFSPDSQTLISGSGDHTVKFWRVKDGTCIKTCTGHGSEIFSVAYSPCGQIVASAGGDNVIRIWDTLNAKCIGILEGHSDSVRSISFSPDGELLASGSDDCTMKIWHWQTRKCCYTYTDFQGWIRAIAFSPDGKTLASGSSDRLLKLWSVSNGKCLDTYRLHDGDVCALAFSPDGKTLASGSSDRTVRLWNYHTSTCIRTIYGHTNQIFAIAFSSDGTSIACVSLDRTVRLWSVSSGQCLKTWQGNTDWIFPVAYSKEKVIASGNNDCTPKIWRSYQSSSLGSSGHEDYICDLAFHPNGKILASSSRDNTIRLWNVHTGKCLRVLHQHEDWVYTIAFSPDGKLLASGSADCTVRLWNADSGKILPVIMEHPGTVWSVAVSPDSQTIATGNTDCRLRLWSVATGKCRQLVGHSDRVLSVAFSPSLERKGKGEIVASGSIDRTIKLWDSDRGKEIQTLVGHDNWVFAVDFSPNGLLLASASHDGTVRIWDVRTGRCLNICTGHTHAVSSVAFSPDGKNIASGSPDRTVRIWDVRTGRCFKVLKTVGLYESMNLMGAKGLNAAQKSALKPFGVIL